MTPCDHCGGSGRLRNGRHAPLRKCPTCSGAGWGATPVFESDTRVRDHGRIAPTTTDDDRPVFSAATLFDDPETCHPEDSE